MSSRCNCANCGKLLQPGEDVIHQAAGTVSEDGFIEVGDHFYMHGRCPGTPDHEEWIRLAIEEIREYVPEWISEVDKDGTTAANGIYHPQSSVNGLRENLMAILTSGQICAHKPPTI